MARARPTTGPQLRAVRTELGVSQAQLARDWGISPRMVRKLESADTIPAGYRDAAGKLAGGRVIAPTRRTTAGGRPVRVRAPGGRTATVEAPRAGSDRGITYARGTGRDAPIVRRVDVWVPYELTPRPGVSRETAFSAVGDAINDAHGRGQRAVVTARQGESPGAGYTITVVGLPDGAPAPHGAGIIVIDVGGDWDDDWDDLADDAGLGYGDAT